METIQKQAESTQVVEITVSKRVGVSIKGLLIIALLAAAVFGYVIWAGITARTHANDELATETNTLAVPTKRRPSLPVIFATAPSGAKFP